MLWLQCHRGNDLIAPSRRSPTGRGDGRAATIYLRRDEYRDTREARWTRRHPRRMSQAISDGDQVPNEFCTQRFERAWTNHDNNNTIRIFGVGSYAFGRFLSSSCSIARFVSRCTRPTFVFTVVVDRKRRAPENRRIAPVIRTCIYSTANVRVLTAMLDRGGGGAMASNRNSKGAHNVVG